MAGGSNDNPSRPRFIDHNLTSVSSSTTFHITSNTPTPSGTCSGTVASFNDATINSGSQNYGTQSVDTCSGTVGSFNNRGSGSQDFQRAKINSGCINYYGDNNANDYSTATVQSTNHSSRTPCSLKTRFASILHNGNSVRKSREQDRLYSGTLNSFNNLRNGDQSFNGAKINSGANSHP